MNMGSFGAAIGGSDSIRQAMERRGMGAGVLQQQSPAAPGFTPMPQAPQGQPSFPMPAAGSPTPAGPLPGSGEAEMILKALSERLKHLSKAEEGAGSALNPLATTGF